MLRVHRHDLIEAHIQPRVAFYVAGIVSNADKLTLVIDSVRLDTKHAQRSTILAPAGVAGTIRQFFTHQKPYGAGSCSLRNNQLKSKLLGLFRERSDLLLAIPGFIVFGPFVHVWLTVFD
jgi:hypothetical protein